jgi:hypothetical protein
MTGDGNGIIEDPKMNGHRTNGHANGNGVSATTDRVKYHPTNVGGIGLADAEVNDGVGGRAGAGTVVGMQSSEEPLTLAGIAARRAKAGKLVAGTAAYADSDMFKSPVFNFFFSLLLPLPLPPFRSFQ